MLVPFAVQTEAIGADYGDLASTLAAHRRLIAVWEAHGVLIHSGTAIQRSEFRDLGHLPQNVRALWERALTKLETRSGGDTWNGIGPDVSREHVRALADVSRVFALSPRASEELALPAERPLEECAQANAELVRFDLLDEAPTFSRLKAQRVSVLPAGMSRETVWRDYFAPLVTYGGAPIVLVDRFAVENGDNRGGLGYLLSQLKAVGRMEVTLFSGISENTRRSDCEALLHEVLRSHDCLRVRVNVHFVPENKFRGIAHDRYFRVRTRVLVLDTGIELLSRQTIGRATRVTFGPTLTEATREAHLRQAASE